MKAALLHPDDYESALSNGMVPWRFDERCADGDIRVAVDPYYPVDKGELVILEMTSPTPVLRVIDDLLDAAPLFPGVPDGEEAVVPVGRKEVRS